MTNSIPCQIPRRRRPRLGYTVADLLVVMAVLSMIVSIVVVTLTSFYRIRTRSLQDGRLAQIIHPLGADLRESANNGTSAELIGPGTFALGSQSLDHQGGLAIHYAHAGQSLFLVDKSSIRRLEIRNGSLASQESYVVPPGVKIDAQIDSWLGRPLLSLRLHRSGVEPVPGQQSFDVRLEACLRSPSDARGTDP